MEWINIKDRLPAEENDVNLGLVYDDDGGTPHIFICSWMDFKHNGRIYYRDDCGKYVDFDKMNDEGMARITHWMPLPDLPNDEAKQCQS